ncbi:TusE/DsrC/DsvC family sulfur relay protein [Thioalkalivibrio thiocyanodenitrificans]|uniref:TusE/DsrC/DsvC family sulfur relay protein n=1 Tax=Thioalkalivibrio thiocyanodenitrificans TaxID=243063 RepID=UPI00037FF32C|nr:TusE/DsrC/DsvC family sulfur relay protein [Thioalkalivibrio thiocyanodenitrificans]
MAATVLKTIDRPAVDPHPEQQTLLDEGGFLIDPALWTEEMAERLAWREGIGVLTEAHWRVILHVRARFHALGGMPSMRRVCRATGFSREAIYGLFGSCLRVWRIAGLPDPGEEAKAYM